MRKLRRVVRLLGRATFVGALLPALAGAQLNITFFNTFPSTPPDPNLPFPGGTVLCTATAAGSPTGISLNFANAALVNSLCGAGASTRINNAQSFGARITGNFVVAAAGTYSANINTDDGDVLTINGVTQNSAWFLKGGGPGAVTLNLLGGTNPFTLDYFQGPCCGAFIDITVGQGITVTPPTPPPSTVPEPGAVALLGTGLLALLVMQRRKRSKRV
jgi:PEP-CTERM motif